MDDKPYDPNYYREPGPYTPPRPRLPDPFRPPRRRGWGPLMVGGALAGLGILGLWWGATTSDGEAREAIPNTVVTSTPPSTPAAAPTTDEVETATDPVKQRTALYLATVRNKYPQTVALSDERLIVLAQSACDVLDSGGTRDDILAVLVDDPGADVENTRVLAYAVGAGVMAFCPQHEAKIRGEQ